jgi:hypothetical protein
MTYQPLAPSLIRGHAHAKTQACVIVPARNEEQLLPRTLEALRLQVDQNGGPLPSKHYEVILLLNNCTDNSEAVAVQYQQAHPDFQLHVAMRILPPAEAHVGTARRLLMDTAYSRLHNKNAPRRAILSTDADTVVAPDWIVRNLAAIHAGADVVGGVINLLPDDLTDLQRQDAGTHLAYQRDRQLQALTAQLESMLDPDPADPWPRHLQHFGASLACTTSMYALAGGLPPVKPLEDVAFLDALRKVGARIRHCPQTHIYTSARLDGRVQVGLSGQLKIWQHQYQNAEPHLVESAQWLEHRFRSIAALRHINASRTLPTLTAYPASWQSRIAALRADRLPNASFLELLDSDALIEELFASTGHPRHAEIETVLFSLTELVAHRAYSSPVEVALIS